MTPDEIGFWIYVVIFFFAGIALIFFASPIRSDECAERDWMRDHVEDTTATTGRRINR